MGWDYALNWLIVLPFEITAAGLTISFWRDLSAPRGIRLRMALE